MKTPMEFQYFWRTPLVSRSIFVICLAEYQQLRFQDFNMIKIRKDLPYFWRIPLVSRSIFVIHLPKYKQLRFQDFKIMKTHKEFKYLENFISVMLDFCHMSSEISTIIDFKISKSMKYQWNFNNFGEFHWCHTRFLPYV